MWFDSAERLPNGARGILLSGADGGGKNTKHGVKPLSLVIPVDPSYWQSWRKALLMADRGFIPNKATVAKTDIFGKGEFAHLSGRPVFLKPSGCAISQDDANRLLRTSLSRWGYLSKEEAACFSIRGLRTGYLSHLHALGYPIEEIAKIAAHSSTETTLEYFRNASGVKKSQKRKRKKKKFQSFLDIINSLPKFAVTESSDEAFMWMKQAARRKLLAGERGSLALRTANANEEVAKAPFKRPNAWKKPWSIFNAEDRRRAGLRGPISSVLGAIKGRTQHSIAHGSSPAVG